MTITMNEVAEYSTAVGTNAQKLNTNLDNFMRDSNNGSRSAVKEASLGLSQAVLNSLQTMTTGMLQVDANHEFANLIGRDTVQTINRQNNIFKQQIANKRRMTEINNYYSNMNNQINFIMRNLVIILAIVIIITVLGKKGIIPKDMSNFATVMAILVVIIYIIYNVYDLNIRDRFNFVQYKIPFSEEARRQRLSGTRQNRLTDNIRDRLFGNTCIGEDCCESLGTRYDRSINACVPEGPPRLAKAIGSLPPDAQDEITRDALIAYREYRERTDG